jgi:predicted RND superfamily exporter protein
LQEINIMWQALGKAVLNNRKKIIAITIIITALLSYEASKVELSYDFSKAIPTDNIKYKTYLDFKNKFGEDGNLVTIGFISNDVFKVPFFNEFSSFQSKLKKINGVEEILSIPGAITLKKNDSTQQLVAVKIFPDSIDDQKTLDSLATIFNTLPFYKGLLYNPESNAFLIGIRINKDLINSKGRKIVIKNIEALTEQFKKENNLNVHLSGLPLIRTNVAEKIANEMKWFLLGSLLLSALILLVFFRSFSTMLLSLSVVIIGVIYSLATLHLMGFKITLLTALIPPLIVVIGIPNCIYFINKYHTSFLRTGDKRKSLEEMVGKMGVVTLFCNISAAVGFAVFALTKSTLLKEFGIVAGINIMALFFISLALIPVALYYMKVPTKKHTQYLENMWMLGLLSRIETWVFGHKKLISLITVISMLISFAGIMRLKTESFIVDDLPKKDPIYEDLKFFEANFKGIMPLEILVDAGRKNGIAGSRALGVFDQVSRFSDEIANSKYMARPLSLAEGLKFARQGFYDGDSNNYSMPNAFDGAFMADYLKAGKDTGSNESSFQKLMSAFIDSNKQVTRISINMADVGSKRMPEIIDSLEQQATQFFDTSKIHLTFTGTSITFLEGSRFIIKGLKESIFWAFLLISLCMLYLFRSLRILLCSLIPNLIPLVMTAGLMGWMNIAIKPSTVLVFSVALGIAIDITIRFLVNYKQELPKFHGDVNQTVLQTIKETGISIVYTSLVLIAGFVIFVFSGFGSTQALGLLTSFTLLVATFTNLVLLPVLLLSVSKRKGTAS